jgi:ferredoxin
MPFVVTESCIRCKFTDCVDVCPADCFYEGANMLVIHPDECIDCGLCEPECPVEAILPESYPEAQPWVEINRDLSLVWPKIVVGHDALPDADEFTKETGKYEKYFNAEPAARVG